MKPSAKAIICILLLVSPLAANAASLIGASLYKDLGKDLFVVGLYSDGTDAASITSGEVESRMELKLISPLSKRRWANLCLQSIAINNSRESLETSAEDLVQIFGNIKGHLITEDSFTVNYAPGQGSTVSLNGITLLQTKGVEILNLFLSIWLGPVPPSTDFKAQILGQQSSGDAAARLSLYAPSQQRVATIKGWVDAEEEVKPEPEPEPEPQVAAVEEPAEEPTEEPAAEEPTEPAPEVAAAETESETTAETEAADASETTVEATAVAAADTGESAPESDAATDEALEEEEEDVEVSVASLLATQEYNTTVVKSIYSSIIYPKAAVRRNRQGTVRVDMLISRAGELIDAQVVESAGFGPLDEAAIAAVKKAAPFPAAPDEIPDDEIQLLLPVSFRLQ